MQHADTTLLAAEGIKKAFGAFYALKASAFISKPGKFTLFSEQMEPGNQPWQKSFVVITNQLKAF